MLHISNSQNVQTKWIMKVNSQSSIIKKLFCIIFILGLVGLQQAYATTYYVSGSGKDTNNGTAEDTP